MVKAGWRNGSGIILLTFLMISMVKFVKIGFGNIIFMTFPLENVGGMKLDEIGPSSTEKYSLH